MEGDAQPLIALGDTHGDQPVRSPLGDDDAGGRADDVSVETSPGATVISPFEEAIHCPVIVYFTNVVEMRDEDAQDLYHILERLGPQEEAAFVIQSPGGDSDAAHFMATLLREYIKRLRVYVPTFASSAATLFCLYADELFMGPASTLSPIDPQVPVDPRLIIPQAGSLEDLGVVGPAYLPAYVIRDFLELTGVLEPAVPRRRKPIIHTERLDALLRQLNPWVLGWYERADKVSRVYAKDALARHLLPGHGDPEHLADEIVEKLMDFYASHDASIVRGEARSIGIPVTDCPSDVWIKLRELSDFYSQVLERQGLGRVLETKTDLKLRPLPNQRQCAQCHELSEGADALSFCPYCGQRVAETCDSCQLPVKEDWDFCPRCGRDLDEVTASAGT